MSKHEQAKAGIFEQIRELLNTRTEELTQAIASIKESRDNESKSSAGDKYETGRAMMQIELDKNETQLRNTLQLKSELSHINLQQSYDRVAFGSLVITNQENYFIAVGMGKIMLGDVAYYAISMASPIGMVLKDQKVGQKISFQGREIAILEII